MSEPLFAALVTQAPDIFSGEVRAALRGDAMDLVLGIVLSVLGFVSLGVIPCEKKQ
jgi:hypothetical protein